MTDTPSPSHPLTLEQVAARLLEAGNHTSTAVSARFLLEALESRSPFATARRSLPANDKFGTKSFPGWDPPDDPEPPARLGPMPLEFEMPVDEGMEAPLPEIAPWWDLIRIPPGAPAEPIAWLDGKRSITGPWIDGWPTRFQAHGPDQAHLRLYERSVEIQAWRSVTTTSIKPSGFLSYVLVGTAA
ncbi:MAG: hypothetical protein KDB04_16530 [Acidimicrobiales bacterium]|nr:hypothetical protein [Acidimicrobiales bacterium]HRW38220.1 hypothetical protein [Aquihabitans sp.]